MLLILLLFVITITIIFYSTKTNLVKIKSQLDDHHYWVKNDKESQKSSNYLSELNKRIVILINYLSVKHSDKDFYKRLKDIYHPDILSENASSLYTSYVLNKKYIVLCIKQKDGSFVDINTMTYVILHELAHLCSKELVQEHEHNTNIEFRTIFKTLIQSGIECGIYKFSDYKTNPASYCGLTINSY